MESKRNFIFQLIFNESSESYLVAIGYRIAKTNRKTNTMKLFQTFFLGGLMTILGCASESAVQGAFYPLPYPQAFEITGASAIGPEDVNYYDFDQEFPFPLLAPLKKQLQKSSTSQKAVLSCKIDSTIMTQPEGYHLEIKRKQIFLTGRDQNGLFYGLATLGQLIEDARDQSVKLPLCKIEDYPALPYRAIHLDVKHHLEKQAYYYELMDELASYKINGIIVELEDKLGYQRQPKVAAPEAFSIEEWKAISDYAKERNIEISPLVQGLGHASFILKHEEYHSLRDNPESDWAFNPLLPQTYEVQFDLYRDAIAATPHGRYLHVGGDEVHTTGGGSGLSPLELQLTWLNKVCDFAASQNRIPIFWDDMPLKHAGVYRAMFNRDLEVDSVNRLWAQNEPNLTEFLEQFPKNCIYMRWNYSSPETVGNRKAMEWFHKNDLQVMGATAGQTRWVLMPQQESNMNAIRAFAEISIENEADGLLLTLWDDDSPHFELYKRGIAAFSENTWKGVSRAKSDIKMAYRKRAFGGNTADSTLAFIDDLEKPVAFWKNALLMGNQRNYLLSKGNLESLYIPLPEVNKKGAWVEAMRERINQAEAMLEISKKVGKRIDVMKSQSQRNQFRLEIYARVNQVAQLTPQILLALRDFDLAKEEEALDSAKEELNQLLSDFSTARADLEKTYSQTRQLNKSEEYLLDQDHHHHLANQSLNFDWQFMAEETYFKRIKDQLLTNPLIH